MSKPAGKVKGGPKDRSVIMREIAQKEKALVKCEDRILALSDVIKHKTKFLKEKNAHEKAVRVAQARIKTHEEYYALDLARRPSDRNDDIRIYTKMDLDTWKYEQVREWFNKKADPSFDGGFHKTPAQTGYMIKIDSDYVEPHLRHTNTRANTNNPAPRSGRHVSPRSALEPVSVSQAPSPRAEH